MVGLPVRATVCSLLIFPAVSAPGRMKLTQTEFGRRLGVSFVTVCRWEKGHSVPLPVFRRQLVAMAETVGKRIPVSVKGG